MPEYLSLKTLLALKKHVLDKALELDQGSLDDSIPVGSYASLHIKEVPLDIAFRISSQAEAMPIITCSLLQHEPMMSVLHFSIKRQNTYDDPIKSKEELIFHVGF